MPRSARFIPDGEDQTPQQDSSDKAQATPSQSQATPEPPTIEQVDAMMPKPQGLSAADIVRQAQDEEARKQAERDAAIQAAAAAAVAEPKVAHVVVSGDTLSGIAAQYYGQADRWPAIYEANMDVIGDDPNFIQIGQELVIPEL